MMGSRRASRRYAKVSKTTTTIVQYDAAFPPPGRHHAGQIRSEDSEAFLGIASVVS